MAKLRVLFIGGTGVISSACSRVAVESGIDLFVLTGDAARPAAAARGQARGHLVPALMRTAEDVLAVAGELADEVLFPDAMRVDRLDVLPAAHLDALAAAGLYGAPAPADAGGLGLTCARSAMWSRNWPAAAWPSRSS